jgi:hypothetical protein
MPFYFAIPRVGNTVAQRRQETGRVDYIRTPPTSLSYFNFAHHTRDVLFVRENLHCLLSSAFAGDKSGKFNVAFKPDVAGIPLFMAFTGIDIVPISLPPVSFSFVELNDTDIEKLDNLGLEERYIKGKGALYVGKMTPQVFQELKNYELNEGYSPVGGSISISGADCFNKILKMITCVAKGLELACDVGVKTGWGVIEYGTYEKVDLVSYRVSDRERSARIRGININTDGMTASEICAWRLPGIVWGSGSALPGVASYGLFCPFEPNYSATDKRALSVFMASFYSVIVDAVEQGTFEVGIEQIWMSELSLTMEGEFAAHMMAVLVLCKKVVARPFFVIENGIYEGAVIHSGLPFNIKLMGGQVFESEGRSEILDDISKYAFHSVALREICDRLALGADVDPTKITSMRMLRKIVMGRKDFAISASDKLWLEKKLLFLNFREKPVSVNVTSLGKFISYIHPTGPTPVPADLYMERSVFFDPKEINNVLSMFGRFVPSPVTAGTAYTIAYAPGSTKKADTLPPVIQMAFKPIQTAGEDWLGFLRGGKIVIPQSKIKRGRRFAGADGVTVGSLLQGVANAAMAASKDQAKVSRILGAEKRKAATDDRDNAEEDQQPLKKVMKLKDLSFMSFATPGSPPPDPSMTS